MAEIREIFETVRTYCGMIFLDAKRPRGEEDKSVSEAARQLGSGATHVALSNNIGSDFKHWCKVLAAKSVMGNTESILAPMAGEDAIVHERLVSVTSAGAGENQNEIIQSYPSPEFLNSLPFIKKFYPAPRCGEGKVTEVAHDDNSNSSETDHASMPLGIFASKSVSHKANVGGVGTPPYVARLLRYYGTKVVSDNNSPETVYSLLTTHHSLKKAAFTLAEVLITLGIIGVVAALTLPTLIQNHQKQVYVTQLKKAYSNISNALSQVVNDEGVVDWDQACIVTTVYDYDEKTNINACLHKVAKQMKALNIKDYGVTCSNDWCKYGHDVDNDIGTSTTLASVGTGMFTTPDGMLYMFPCWALTNVVVDVNGINKSPNQPGRDIFEFYACENKYESGEWSYECKNALSPVGSGSSNSCSATRLSTGCTAKVLIEGKMNY